MNKEVFFFDTYALFEIIKGNEKYIEYAKVGGVTTIFNIAEFNYNLKKERSKEEANKITDDFKSKTIKVEWEDLKKAMDLKIKHKDLSIPDAIGYIVALRLEIRFLTGDDDFKDLENVEFVKK
ncbi:PIN domain-containing protein [Candidatus Pacearchaeota archaeon]|nr:PIN domain-containing protein [Candidatus Pacearchaeota archaeon]